VGSWVRILLRKRQYQLLIYEIDTNLFSLPKKIVGPDKQQKQIIQIVPDLVVIRNPSTGRISRKQLTKIIRRLFGSVSCFSRALYYLISQAGREPSLSENDWQRFAEAFQVPARQQEPEKSGQVQKKIDSELEQGKSSSRDGYGNPKAYVYQ